MRLSFADTGLATIDALEGLDAASLFVFEDQRPLKGAAGYIDWRLCGGLSQILKAGRFVGERGDALLFPTGGRLRFERVFCFGAGQRRAFTVSVYSALVKRACEAMSLAGSRAFVTELPPVPGAGDEGIAQAFISEGATRFKGERIVLLGDGKALAKLFSQTAGRMKGLSVDSEPLGAAPRVVVPAPLPAGKNARR
ncbi:MAG: M17 family peptidase N-terminal domain-containing protein [Myxococcales bacterium]|jgi:hypothetical protein